MLLGGALRLDQLPRLILPESISFFCIGARRVFRLLVCIFPCRGVFSPRIRAFFAFRIGRRAAFRRPGTCFRLACLRRGFSGSCFRGARPCSGFRLACPRRGFSGGCFRGARPCSGFRSACPRCGFSGSCFRGARFPGCGFFGATRRRFRNGIRILLHIRRLFFGVCRNDPLLFAIFYSILHNFVEKVKQRRKKAA